MPIEWEPYQDGAYWQLNTWDAALGDVVMRRCELCACCPGCCECEYGEFEDGVPFCDCPDSSRLDGHRLPFEVRASIGAFLYAAKAQPGVSTFIDEVTTTFGYGRLSPFGDWEYPVMPYDRAVADYMRGFPK